MNTPQPSTLRRQRRLPNAVSTRWPTWVWSIGVVLALVPGIARAHEEQIVADPAPGERASDVEHIEVDFLVEVESPGLRVIGPKGTAVEGSIRLEESRIAVLEPTEMLAEPGSYVVEYFARTGDGHAIVGAYEFTIDGRSAATSRDTLFIGALIALGALVGAGGVFWLVIRRRHTPVLLASREGATHTRQRRP
jgi:methionine-rich copper-binding protein CopC